MTSYIIYKAYVLPRLLYGLETLSLTTLVNVYVDLVVPVLHRPEVVDIGVNTI